MEHLIPKRKLRILLVDDAVDDAMLLAELLRHLGQDTLAVSDGPQAVEMLATFRPHIVILDIDMPAMDGFELAAAVRRTRGMEKVAIFALSGWNDQTIRDRCGKAGFNRFFAKPTPVSDILFALREYEK